MSQAKTEDIAAELERASEAGLRRSLELLAEGGRIRNVAELVAFQARAAEAMTAAALADAALIARAAMRALEGDPPLQTPADLANRAMRSGLAHAGEPPDYAADNE